jgi:hypothetical protein
LTNTLWAICARKDDEKDEICDIAGELGTGEPARIGQDPAKVTGLCGSLVFWIVGVAHAVVSSAYVPFLFQAARELKGAGVFFFSLYVNSGSLVRFDFHIYRMIFAECVNCRGCMTSYSEAAWCALRFPGPM